MTPETMQLVLIRHGESQWNKANLFTGWSDIDLTEKGRNEAYNGGVALKDAGYDFDICYTSYLKRAIHTLNLVLDALDRDWLPVEKTWKLNERHYGALQGLNKADTAAKYGEEQVRIWRRSFDVRPPCAGAGRSARRPQPAGLPQHPGQRDPLRRVPRRHHRSRMALVPAGGRAANARWSACAHRRPRQLAALSGHGV